MIRLIRLSFALVLLLVTFTASSPVSAATLRTKFWQGQTMYFGELGYYVKQTAEVTIYYNADGTPHHAHVDRVRCVTGGISPVLIEKTWCGYVKLDRNRIDFGMNYTRKLLGLPVGVTDECWIRQHATAAYNYSDSRKLFFPAESGNAAYPYWPRQGCG